MQLLHLVGFTSLRGRRSLPTQFTTYIKLHNLYATSHSEWQSLAPHTGIDSSINEAVSGCIAQNDTHLLSKSPYTMQCETGILNVYIDTKLGSSVARTEIDDVLWRNGDNYITRRFTIYIPLVCTTHT